MTLYTVRFTTKRKITRYDNRRRPIETTETEIEVVLKSLPAETAQSYSKCDNFSMLAEPRYDSDKTVYRRRDRPTSAATTVRRAPERKTPSARPTAHRSKNAAATGDMSAAINS